jgi:DNA-nicking Smr family endonuclease
MSRGGKSGDGKRAITPDEAALWDQATRTLAPVKAKPRVSQAVQADPSTPAGSRAKPQPPSPKGKAPPAAPSRPPAHPPRAPLPPLADFDRRKMRQIASGKVEIEARIDLPGLRQRDAAERLRAFLLDAHARGLKMVLVITGKGGEPQRGDYMTEQLGEQRRGVLHRSVPQWLAEPELRAVVLGHTPAGVRHGGEGALYVQLRKGGRG